MRAERVSPKKTLPQFRRGPPKNSLPFPEKRRSASPFLEPLEFFQPQNLKILPKNATKNGPKIDLKNF